MALTHTPLVDPKFQCPDFDLLAVDGQKYRLSSFSDANALVVMFICNHCPYVKAIEDRLITLAREIKSFGGQVVGICSNDGVNYPEDSFANLKKRWTEKSYGFPYLHDETQSVAKSFGAVCTPDFFVFNKDRKLRYRGRLDDSWKEPQKVTRQELLLATKSIAQTGELSISFDQTPSMGCSIKWL